MLATRAFRSRPFWLSSWMRANAFRGLITRHKTAPPPAGVPALSLNYHSFRPLRGGTSSSWIWFLLVGADGKNYKGTTASAVSLPPAGGADVVDFRKAVKAKFDYPHYLKDIPSAVLKVFRNKEAFAGKEDPLKSSAPLDGLGGSVKDALIVLVPNEEQDWYMPLLPFDPSAYKPKVFGETAERSASFRLLGRRKQVEEIVGILEGSNHNKLTPIVVCSSRGMGKTFLLQKLAFNQLEGSGVDEKILPLENALRCGRVCAHLSLDLFCLNDYDTTSAHYASAIVVEHVLDLFRGSSVGDIRFTLAPSFRLLLRPDWADCFKRNSRLQALVGSMLGSPEKAFSEWLRLTKVAFGLSDRESASIRPVILFDEMQYLCVETTRRSSTGVPYTFLAEVLTDFHNTACSPIVMCAGTHQGSFSRFEEYSSIVPMNIRLTPLSLDDANNRLMDCVPMMYYEEEFKSISADEIAKIDKTIYWQSYGIPRLLVIGYATWISKRVEAGKPIEFGLAQFQRAAELYYREAVFQIFEEGSRYSANDLAMIFLSGHVYHPVQDVESCVPGTEIKWTTLMHSSVVFPANNGCFLMPPVLSPHLKMKRTLASYAESIDRTRPRIYRPPKKLGECTERLRDLIPGLDLRDLQVDFEDFDAYRNQSLQKHGRRFERMFISSLAVRYHLARTSGAKDSVPFSDVYAYNTNSLLGEALDHWNFQVNLKDGIVDDPDSMDTDSHVSNRMKNAIYIKQRSTNAHRHAVIPATPKPIAVSCKFSKKPSDTATLVNHLTTIQDKDSVLFSVSLANHDTATHAPKSYRSATIKSAIETKRLMFLSGVGCISPVLMELLMAIKQSK